MSDFRIGIYDYYFAHIGKLIYGQRVSCGSLAMQKDVLALLETICQTKLGKPVSVYQSHSQILMDCY